LPQNVEEEFIVAFCKWNSLHLSSLKLKELSVLAFKYESQKFSFSGDLGINRGIILKEKSRRQ